MQFDAILNEARNREISPQEALFLFEQTNRMDRFAKLLQCASYVRDQHKGREFKLWAHVPSTTVGCITNPPCRYCGISRAMQKDRSGRSKATPKQLAAIAAMAEELGFEGIQPGGGCTGLNGRDAVEDARIISAATRIKIYANYGYDMNEQNLLALKELRVNRVGAQLEFVHPKMFYKIKPGDNLEKRKEVLSLIEKHDMGLDSGLMIGVGESYKDRVDGIFYLKGFNNLVRTSICGFMPIPGTPMENYFPATSMDIAVTLAIMRLVLRQVDIEGTFGRDDQLQLWIAAGTNIRLIHGLFTPTVKGGNHRRPFFRADTLPVTEGFQYLNLLPFYVRMIEETGMRTNLNPLSERATLLLRSSQTKGGKF